MDMMCCKCKKRPAMLYVAKFDGKEMTNEGYCLKCAAELGLPQVKSMMDRYISSMPQSASTELSLRLSRAWLSSSAGWPISV